jgi:hypothetical protein
MSGVFNNGTITAQRDASHIPGNLFDINLNLIQNCCLVEGAYNILIAFSAALTLYCSRHHANQNFASVQKACKEHLHQVVQVATVMGAADINRIMSEY